MVAIVYFLETKSAPLAGCWAVNMALVKLNILNGMSKTEFVDAHATSSVTVDLNDWHLVNEFLSIRPMCLRRYLKN